MAQTRINTGKVREWMVRRQEQIWPEEKKKKRNKQTAAAWWKEHRYELFYVLMMGGFLFLLSWILPYNQGPDEKMRYLIPRYIYRHGTLPKGWESEIQSDIWGISYAYHSYLPYILAGYLMKITALFSTSQKALLMTARLVNVCLGAGFYWYVLQIARKLFQRPLFRYYFVALLSMLPQLLYLFVYVNMDGMAMFSSAMMVHYWLEGIESRWDKRSCTGLAVSVSVCALSYYNAYGFALFSVIVFVGTQLIWGLRNDAKCCLKKIWQKGIYITVIVLVLSGWWYVRAAILYEGDILGFEVQKEYAEQYAQEEYKPSVKKSVQQQGISLDEMLRPESEGGMEWIRTSWRSTIGYFGFLEHPLGLDIYEIHKKLILLGMLGMAWHFVTECLKSVRSGYERKKNRKKRVPDPGKLIHCLLQFSFGCCIIIPVLLSLYYSYTSDFQPQGRYLMPMILPLMYFVAAGTEYALTAVFKNWVVRLLMIVQYYAVLHVFLAAFVSVYLPTYCEKFEFLSQVRFLWFSNSQIVTLLLSLLIPG